MKLQQNAGRASWWRGLWVVGSVAAIAVGTPRQSRAQVAGHERGRDSTQRAVPETASGSLYGLPVRRRPATPQVVEHAGDMRREDGSFATSPTTVLASVALGDLQAYAQQLDWVFPLVVLDYPADSVIRVQHDRAVAWVRRLLAVRPRASWTAWGEELVSFGEVASRAGNDTLAAQLFDTRLAMLTGHLAEQSYVLRQAIDVFTDPTQDSARLARNLVTADRYLVTLRALPRAGYRTENDSESVMLRQYSAEARVIEGYDAIGASGEIVKRAMRLLENMARQNVAEQYYEFSGIPYPVVVSAMAGQPNAAANIATLNAQYVAVGGEAAQDMIACMAMIRQPAPPLAANAWLHTPDSVYRETPWVKPFTDGIVRVLLLQDAYSTDYVSVLERVQHAFPMGVQAVFVTQTIGFFNSHTARPEDEIAWLSTMYHDKRHLTVPIAIWAGKRRMLEEEGSEPIRSPANEAYHTQQLEGLARVMVVLVDGHGILQGFQSIVTRADEVKLMRRIAALLAAEHPSGHTPARAVERAPASNVDERAMSAVPLATPSSAP